MRDKKLCQSVGITEVSTICKSFKPNTYDLIPLIEEGKTFDAIKNLMALIPDDKLRIIGAMFMRENLTRDAGYGMGKKVYVRYRGQANSNYLSNFFSAYILYADNDMVRVTSRDGKCCMTFAGMARSVIYTASEFKKMRTNMIKAHRYSDPDVTRMIAKRLRCMEEYELGVVDIAYGEVPTIDSVMGEYVTNSKSSRKGPADLRDIVNAIENGYDVKAVTKKKQKADVPKKSKPGKVVNGALEYNISYSD